MHFLCIYCTWSSYYFLNLWLDIFVSFEDFLAIMSSNIGSLLFSLVFPFGTLNYTYIRFWRFVPYSLSLFLVLFSLYFNLDIFFFMNLISRSFSSLELCLTFYYTYVLHSPFQFIIMFSSREVICFLLWIYFNFFIVLVCLCSYNKTGGRL